MKLGYGAVVRGVGMLFRFGIGAVFVIALAVTVYAFTTRRNGGEVGIGADSGHALPSVGPEANINGPASSRPRTADIENTRLTRDLIEQSKPAYLGEATDSIALANARVLLDRLEQDRQDLIDTVLRETTMEAVGSLRKEPLSELFMSAVEKYGLLESEPSSYQHRILSDPRVIKVMLAILNGTDAERHAILESLLGELGTYLSEQEDASQGSRGQSSLNGVAAYPIFLAEVDRAGDSIPLLVRFYDIELQKATGIVEGFVNYSGYPSQDGDGSTRARTTMMPLIAGACDVIIDRSEGHNYDSFDSSSRTSRSRVYVPQQPLSNFASELSGYVLMPTPSIIPDMTSTMNRAREFMGRN